MIIYNYSFWYTIIHVLQRPLEKVNAWAPERNFENPVQTILIRKKKGSTILNLKVTGAKGTFPEIKALLIFI